jgi:hypothetical protein
MSFNFRLVNDLESDTYCHVFIVPWLIITGFWVGWLDLVTPSCMISQSVTMTHSQSSGVPSFLECLGPAPFSFSFCDWLLSFDWTTYIVSRRIHKEHVHRPAMDTCEQHRKHLFLYCCIYSAFHSNGLVRIRCCGNVFTAPLPRNGSICHSIFEYLKKNYTWSANIRNVSSISNASILFRISAWTRSNLNEGFLGFLSSYR